MRTTAIMKYVPASQITANTRRNFALNPLRADQIDKLVESYNRNGQKEALSVSPNADGTYELAAGHHRLAAMGGLTEHLPEDHSGVCFAPHQGVRVLVEAMDEDQMTRWMIDENSTQPGSTPGVDVDSIAAVVHRVAYLLISGAECPSWMKGIPERDTHNGHDAWEMARTYLNKGDGLGNKIIRAYGVGGMSKHRVEQAIANLKGLEHGGMADIIASARAEYEAEIAAEQAEEARRLKEIKDQVAEEAQKAKEAAKRRKELERQRKEAEAAQDAKRIEIQRKLREKAEQEEHERAERMRKAAEEKARIEKQQAVEAERVRKAKAAEDKMREQAREKGIHVSLLNVMSVKALDAFRSAVNRFGFTVNEQPALWSDLEKVGKDLDRKTKYGTPAEEYAVPYLAGRAALRDSDKFKKSEHHDIVVQGIRNIRDASGEPLVREAEIVAYINAQASKFDKKRQEILSKIEQDRQARRESEQWTNKADRVMDEAGAAFGRLHSALNAVQALMNEADTHERVAEVILQAQTSSLRKNMDVTEGTINDIRRVFGLWKSSMAKGSTYDVDSSVIEVQ